MDEVRPVWDISEAELLSAIAEATGAAGQVEGRTTREWAEYWKCSESKADNLLRRADHAGLLIPDRAPRLNRGGVWMRTMVYRFRPRPQE